MRKLNAIPFSIYTHANQYVLLYLKDHVTAPQFAEFSSERPRRVRDFWRNRLRIAMYALLFTFYDSDTSPIFT